MPWKESSPMLERMAFVRAVASEEDSMSALCAQFGISRKTGYKWLGRFEEQGEAGMGEYSRAPHRHPNCMPEAVEQAIVELRKHRRHWGPKKLAVKLRDAFWEEDVPSLTSIANVLSRNGLSAPRKRRRHATPSISPLHEATECNRTWSIDFKGWFRTKDGRRLDPLTVTDAYSRYLLCLQAMSGKTDTAHVMAVLRNAFCEYGLPERIRSDNGAPFASTGLAGLSRLSVWWVQLGIVPERIQPGCPQQNGRHERFHLTLLQETISPPAATPQRQQRCFDRFRRDYNDERPHEALGQIPPRTLYHRSPREFPRRIAKIEYPPAMDVRQVRGAGQIKWRGHDVYVSVALTGQPVGIQEIADGRWAVYYSFVRLGAFDGRTRKVRADTKTQAKP